MPVKVILRGQALEAFDLLEHRTDKEAIALLKSIRRARDILKVDPQHGDVLKKALIPASMKRLGVHTLYRMELAKYWRMLYTIQSGTVEIYVIVLTIVDHPSYDRLLGYKKQ